MKIAFLFAGLVFAAAPAAAQVVHQASVDHNGRTVAVKYEPRIETQLRQIGIGPRATAACIWISKVTVRRTALGADGQPIAALTRVISPAKERSGQRVGHCATLPERVKARLAGSDDALRSHVAAAAGRDAHDLRAEMASLASLGAGGAHAR